MNTMDRTSHTHPGPTMIITTSCNTVSDVLPKDPARTRKHLKHKTLNNALVPINKV